MTDCGVLEGLEKFSAFGTVFLPRNATAMPHILISTQIRLVRTFFVIILALLQIETAYMQILSQKWY